MATTDETEVSAAERALMARVARAGVRQFLASSRAAILAIRADRASRNVGEQLDRLVMGEKPFVHTGDVRRLARVTKQMASTLNERARALQALADADDELWALRHPEVTAEDEGESDARA